MHSRPRLGCKGKTLKFSISKTDLLEALSIVSKGMSGRSTLPILSGIYINVEDGFITLQATDLEISVRHKIPALVEVPGTAVVPGKIFHDIVRSLPDAAISCSFADEVFNIECMSSSFNMTTMRPDEFPAFPQVNLIDSIDLPASTLAKMVKKVSKATSRDQTHMVLMGINLTVEDEKLTMVATDSYRLAITNLTVEGHQGLFSLIVPGITFDEVCKLAAKEETVTIGYSENQIVFEFGNSTFVTRKLEGNYPNYRQIIPSEKKVTAVVDTKVFTEAVKRASIMAQEYMQIRLDISPDAQQIEITSNTSDVGGVEERVEAQVEGEEIVIGFNYQYIMDGLNSVDSDEVIFEADSPLKPGVLKSVGDDGFFYLSMPVRLNS